MADSNPRKPGGLLARLFGVAKTNGEENERPADEPVSDETPKPIEEDQDTAAPNAADDVNPSTDLEKMSDHSDLPTEPASEPSGVFLTGPDSNAPDPDPEPDASTDHEVLPVTEDDIDLAAPLAKPVESAEIKPVPLATPIEPVESTELPQTPVAMPLSAEDASAVTESRDFSALEEHDITEKMSPPELQQCPACGADRDGDNPYCADCGFLYPPSISEQGEAGQFADNAGASALPANGKRIQNRYELVQQISERTGVLRYRGLDHGDGGAQPKPVIIVCAPIQELPEPEPVDEAELELDANDTDIMPTFDDAVPVAEFADSPVQWPSVQWERAILESAVHSAIPEVIDFVLENGYEYLIEELPQGTSLWDAWDDPEANAYTRYGYLHQIAEGLHALHQNNAMIEGVNPNMIVVTSDGRAMMADVSDLLPIPLPEHPPIRATLYTAPELIVSPQEADARADLYSFGAMVYSLEYLHHPLEEKDFEHQFSPNLITDRYPDVHPTFFRLICKTFVRDLNTRFPTDEESKKDATGFEELMRTIDICRNNLDKVRLDIAAWTTTGMVRTGNEDAFAFLHAVEQRQDDLFEYALLFLTDGMGGYEAGEVAAAMAIAELRQYLLQQPMFAALSGKETPAEDVFNIDECKKIFVDALRYTNKQVYEASKDPNRGRRGMGCTAEVVYIDSKNIVVGHVGDSRVYHVHFGRLKQVTSDQTFVNRMVELGRLTEEEAENHPRKNELQQAIGGQPDVTPVAYDANLQRGDWVLVCSDGLSNHVPNRDLEMMLTRETAGSSEEAARRLLNLVNLRGATDNSTIVVARAT